MTIKLYKYATCKNNAGILPMGLNNNYLLVGGNIRYNAKEYYKKICPNMVALYYLGDNRFRVIYED